MGGAWIFVQRPICVGLLRGVALIVCYITMLALVPISGHWLSNFHWLLSLVGCLLFLKTFRVEVTQIADDHG